MTLARTCRARAALLLASSSATAMTGGSVDAKFRGDWVPAKAACTSPLKLVIDANRVTFANGAQRTEYLVAGTEQALAQADQQRRAKETANATKNAAAPKL